MTIQTKHYIELSDILALRFECRQCRTTVSVPLANNFDLKKLQDCPTCGKTWLSTPLSTSIEPEVQAVISSLNALRRALPPEGKFETCLAMTLEIQSQQP